MQNSRVAVTGAGGFIGSHLVTYLKEKGYWGRGIDLKYPEFSTSDADEFEILDLRRWEDCLRATHEVSEGLGFSGIVPLVSKPEGNCGPAE